MSYAEVIGAMQTIQARIAELTPAPGVSAASASGFASALSGATGTGTVSAADGTSAATGASTAAGGVTGDDVVQAAMAYKGVPYVLGGESKQGIDCSGLVQAAFKDVGVDVPRLVHQQKTIGQKVDSLKDAKPGDLIVLNGGDHIAIYLGHDTVIHAPYPGRTVSVQKAWFDDKDITTIRRIVPATSDATAGASSSGATLSAATIARATAMVGLAGTSTGDGSSSLGSMLSSFGLGGTGSSSTSQQLLAARAAMLGTES